MPSHPDHAAAARSLRCQRGYTLIEMMVALLLFMAMMAIIVPFLVTAMRAQPRISDKSNDIQRARTTVDRMIRELRSGFAVQGASSSGLTFRTYTRKLNCGEAGVLPSGAPATPCRVIYACSPSGTCTRSEGPVEGGGTTEILVQGLANNDVFGFTPIAASPSYIEISLEFRGENDDTITLEDGVELRNVAGA